MDEEKKVTPAESGADKAVADKDAKAAAKEAKAAAKAEKKAEKAKEKLQKERAKKEMHDIAPGGVSKAEEARLKRKADMEKSQKRQEEKARKRKELTKKQKRIRVITPIAAVVLALVLFFLGYFGVYDRHTTAIKLQDGSKVSVAEYEYYYRSMYNYYYNMSYQYESYYSSYYGTGAGASLTGFDYTKAPADQELPSSSSDSDSSSDSSSTSDDFQVDEEYIKGDKATWDDYFCQAAVETAQLYTALYEQAVDAGYEMTEDETTEMNEFFDDLKSNAEENEYSLDAYIRNNYGKGMNKALLQEIYIKQTLASDYSDDKKEQYSADVTDDEINTYLSENKAEYETASLRYYNFSASVDDTDNATDEEITAANEEAKAKAEAFLSEADDSNWTSKVYDVVDEAYKSYYKDNDSYSTLTDANESTLKSYFTDEATEWIENEASTGDKKLFTKVSDTTGLATYYAILVTEKPSLKDVYPVTVRHLLIQVSDDDDDSSDSDSSSDSSSDDSSTTTHTDAEAKELAEKYYQEWKDGDATDDSFKKLVIAHSEDSGVSDNEGLYEDITPSSSYVQEFLDWCFADGRKSGDSGIIKTEYGYHIMYCVSVATEPQWKTTIRSTLGEEAYNDFYDSAADADEYQIKSKQCISLVRHRENRYAQKTLANMSASSSTAS